MRVLVLMHVACEPAALYESILLERGIAVDSVLLDEGIALPDWRDYAAILAMGGPMGAYDDDKVPWLTAEKQWIADALRAGVPFWGVCLGAQLLAAALGANVYPGAAPEVGMSRVALAADASNDPVFGSLPGEFPVFQWHGDTFDLPADAALLAGNAAYPHQAFRVGSAYGLQFHVEVDAALAAEWLTIPAYASALASVHGPDSADRVLAEFNTDVDVTLALARQMFEAWLDAYVSPGGRS